MGPCTLPGGGNFLAAASAYSAFAGILGGFLFLGVITLMTERAQSRDSRTNRENALMLFLPALLCLLISSFLFGEVSGEQVCARGYMEGIFAASLLAIGGMGVFGGIGWMLDVYASENKDLKTTARVFTFISFFIISALLAVSGDDVIENAFKNNAPSYAVWPIIAYGPVLLILIAVTRLWFMPKKPKRAQARRTAVYFPGAYTVAVVVLYSILTAYVPKYWPTQTLNDWKEYLGVSVALFFPGANLIVYARAIPGGNAWSTIAQRQPIRRWSTRRAARRQLLPGAPSESTATE